MAKDPAFLFYSQDWVVGCQTLTMQERGQYMTLLCMMHQQGRMDEETIRLLVGSVSVRLMSKFKQDELGLFYSERLEKEVFLRKNFVESRRKNGAKGGKPKSSTPKKPIKPIGKPNDKHMGGLMENEIENENEDVNRKEKVLDFEILKHPYLQKILTDHKILLKMKEPLTEDEAKRLEIDFGDQVVYDLLDRMSNWKKITTNNVSVNKTLRKWYAKDHEHKSNGTTNGQPEEKFGRLSRSSVTNVVNRPKLPQPD